MSWVLCSLYFLQQYQYFNFYYGWGLAVPYNDKKRVVKCFIRKIYGVYLVILKITNVAWGYLEMTEIRKQEGLAVKFKNTSMSLKVWEWEVWIDGGIFGEYENYISETNFFRYATFFCEATSKSIATDN